MKKFFVVIFLICMIFLGFYILKEKNSNNNILDKFTSSISDENKIQNDINTRSQDELLNCNLPKLNKYIKINMPTALSYKSRREVFASRMNYVNQSIFSCNNYKPSAEPFGGIEDGKPWISTKRCHNEGDHFNITGDSEETRDLNNPSILITIDWPYGLYYKYTNNENDCTFLIIPKSAKYKAFDKEIEVVYDLSFYSRNNAPFVFKGINARDFGYNYAYLDPAKSKNIVDFEDSNNISTDIIEFQDYIHVGGSCGVEGGCNNGSPYQPFLNFFFTKNNKDAVLYFKLWKEQPESKDAPADIYEKMIIKSENNNSPYLRFFRKLCYNQFKSEV